MTNARFVASLLAVTWFGLARPALAADIWVSYPEWDIDEVDGLCSMREAVDTSNRNICHEDCGCGSDDGFDVIHLNPGAPHELSRELRFTDDVIISGSAADRPIIIGKSNLRGIVAESGTLVYVDDVTVTGFGRGAFFASGEGSGMWLTRVQVTGNKFVIGSGQAGAVIVQKHAYIGMDGCHIHHNTGNIKGGGIFIGTDGAAYAMYNTVIEYNTASQYGGGVHNQGYFNCYNSFINNNSAGIRGGGLYKTVSGGWSNDQCWIYDNSAPSDPDLHED